MRSVDLVRSELLKYGFQKSLSIETRRMLVNRAKKAKKTGNNPKVVVEQFLRHLDKANNST